MKNILKYIVTISCCWVLNAQTGIDTDTPNDATILHVNSLNKGVLIPRIQLTDLTSQDPLIGSLEEGTLIFNKDIAGSGENKIFTGFYFWKDSQWNSLVSKNQESDYKAVQYTNDLASTQDFNGQNTDLGKETDIFGVEVFNDNSSLFTKISNTSIQLNGDGQYIINLNLSLVDQTSNFQTASVNSNVEIYLGFTIEGAGDTERYIAEKILTMVPQVRISGSELISDDTPPSINQSSSLALRRQYARGKFSYALSTYVQAKAGQIIRLRALQNNTGGRADGIVTYDPESISNITIVKIK